jgi:hypothetical protein
MTSAMACAIFATAPVATSLDQKGNTVPEMDEHGSYGQFCPVALAAEILCNR